MYKESRSHEWTREELVLDVTWDAILEDYEGAIYHGAEMIHVSVYDEHGIVHSLDEHLLDSNHFLYSGIMSLIENYECNSEIDWKEIDNLRLINKFVNESYNPKNIQL